MTTLELAPCQAYTTTGPKPTPFLLGLSRGVVRGEGGSGQNKDTLSISICTAAEITTSSIAATDTASLQNLTHITYVGGKHRDFPL